MRLIVALVFVALVGACASFHRPARPPAPPTAQERNALGPDANDPYFLEKWRDCTAFASQSYCKAEIYGGHLH